MTDQNHIAPNYRGLADGKGERQQPVNAVSDTQHELLELAPGERWAHNRVRGPRELKFSEEGAAQAIANEGSGRDFTLAEAGAPDEVTDNTELPKRIPEGITTKYEVTDRRLDHDGEFGYPTPT